jgi:hypothetical protein
MVAPRRSGDDENAFRHVRKIEGPIMNRTAIALLSFAALAAGSAAHAQGAVYPTAPGVNGGMNSGNITAHKQKELAKIQEKMQVLQSLQSCVNGATTSEAIKQCNETARASMGHGGQKKC